MPNKQLTPTTPESGMSTAAKRYIDFLNSVVDEIADRSDATGPNKRKAAVSKSPITKNGKRFFNNLPFEGPTAILPRSKHETIVVDIERAWRKVGGFRVEAIAKLHELHREYVEATIPLQERPQDSFRKLLSEHKLELHNLSDNTAYDQFLDSIIYKPTIAGDKSICETNIRTLLSALRIDADLHKLKHFKRIRLSGWSIAAHSLSRIGHRYEETVLNWMRMASNDDRFDAVLRLNVINQAFYRSPSAQLAKTALHVSGSAVDYTWDKRLRGASERMLMELAFLGERKPNERIVAFSDRNLIDLVNEQLENKIELGLGTGSEWNIRSHFVSERAQSGDRDETLIRAEQFRRELENSNTALPQFDVRLLLDEARVYWINGAEVEAAIKYLAARRIAEAHSIPLVQPGRVKYQAKLLSSIVNSRALQKVMGGP